MSTESLGDQHIYRARLDFLYQSIAGYAATLVIYLIIRSVAVTEAFPSLWQDPLLLLLSAITLLSVFALVYNLIMRRQIEIGPSEVRFTSRARHRTISRNEVRYVQFGSPRGPTRSAVRVVRIGIVDRRRPVRIRLANFERGKALLSELRAWAGPLATDRKRSKRILRRSADGASQSPNISR